MVVWRCRGLAPAHGDSNGRCTYRHPACPPSPASQQVSFKVGRLKQMLKSGSLDGYLRSHPVPVIEGPGGALFMTGAQSFGGVKTRAARVRGRGCAWFASMASLCVQSCLGLQAAISAGCCSHPHLGADHHHLASALVKLAAQVDSPKDRAKGRSKVPQASLRAPEAGTHSSRRVGGLPFHASCVPCCQSQAQLAAHGCRDPRLLPFAPGPPAAVH